MTSFSSLTSVSLTSSGNQMVDALAMARQNSISKNAFTVVAIKTQGAGAYSTYCLIELKRNDDGTFGQWTAITPWRNLGPGIVFESGQPNDTFVATTPSLPLAMPTSFPFRGTQIDLTTSAVSQCYQPDGTLLGGQRPALRLRLTQGVVDPSSGAFTYQGVTKGGQKTSYYDLVFVDNTGATQIERP